MPYFCLEEYNNLDIMITLMHTSRLSKFLMTTEGFKMYNCLPIIPFLTSGIRHDLEDVARSTDVALRPHLSLFYHHYIPDLFHSARLHAHGQTRITHGL